MDILLICAGSEVKSIELDAGSTGAVHVRFSAARIQRMAPDALRPTEEGYLRPLDLVFHGAQVQGELSAALGTLAEAGLWQRGKPWRQPRLPLRLQGGVRAELVFHNGTVLRIEAASVICAPGAEAVFQESLAC